MGELLGERMRETEKEREKGSETDVPKLYNYNEYEHSVTGEGRGGVGESKRVRHK